MLSENAPDDPVLNGRVLAGCLTKTTKITHFGLPPGIEQSPQAFIYYNNTTLVPECLCSDAVSTTGCLCDLEQLTGIF